MRGTVVDSNGAVFSGLNIYVAKGAEKRTFPTDINGLFELRLQPGTYEVTLDKLYSKDFRTFIKIEENRINPDNLTFVIDPDPFCCKGGSGIITPKMIGPLRPPYPPAARAVRAWGEVAVHIKINRDGYVILATADSGHPLLRRVAELAARSASFEPSDEEIRDGYLNFVFLIPGDKKKDVPRFSSQYRIEVIGEPEVILNTVDR